MLYRSFLKVSAGAAAVASMFVWVACSSSTPATSGNPDGGPGNGSSSGGASGGSSGSSSGGSSGGGSGGGSGSSSGSASSSGSSSGANGGACPQAACPSGETCCADLTTQSTTCSASCAAADLVACTGSADCAGSTDGGTECCATAILNINTDGGNTFPRGCLVDSITAYCGKCNNAPLELGTPALTCTTNGDASVEHVHVCTTPADCAGEPTNTKCCPVFSYNICLSAVLAGIGGLTCQDGG
jgi:hypothetical protein